MTQSKNTKSIYRYDKATVDRLRSEIALLSEDERDEELYDSMEYEVSYAFQLIRAGYVEPNVFVTGDWVQEIQERFTAPNTTPSILSDLSTVLPVMGYEWSPIVGLSESNYALPPRLGEAMERLDGQWKSIYSSPSYGSELREGENALPNFRDPTPVHAFMNAISFGSFPTPEVLLSIAKAFELYFSAGGELSLEEVFFGRPKKRSGVFASRSIGEMRYLFFHDTLRKETALLGKKRMTVIELADKFLTYVHTDIDGEVAYFDVDTFLRGYRRWRTQFEEETSGEDS